MPELESYQSTFEQALLAQDRLAARRVFADVVARGIAVTKVEQMVASTLERIGQKWDTGEVALSQLYQSGRICEELVAGLLPTASLDTRRRPKLAIAVLDDYEALGKHMVYAVLRASGFTLLDYGRVTARQAVERVTDDDVKLLLISVLMLPSALHVRQVRAGLQAAGADTKLVVGGAPFRLDAELWREVGADAMGRTATEAPSLVNRFLGSQP